MKRRFFLALVPITLVLGLGPFAQAADATPCVWNPVVPSLSVCLFQ